MDQRKKTQIFVISCAAYVSFGLLNATLGPLLEEFAGKNGVSLATVGSVFTALFVGAILAQVVIGPFTDRLGHHRALAIACLVLSTLLTAVTFSRWFPLTLGLLFLAGLGYGTAVLCGNVLVGRLYEENPVSPLNWLNMFFGMGDVLGPLLVSLALLLWKTGMPAIWIGSLGMFISGILLIVSSFKFDLEKQKAAEAAREPFHFTPFLLSLAGMVLIYVGSEAAIGGWTTTYLHTSTTLTVETAALVTSGFWLALTLGRLMGALFSTRLSPSVLLKFCLGVVLLGALTFVLGYGNEIWSVVAILLLGFGFGPIYPTIFGMMTSITKGSSGKAGSLLTAMGSISGALIPWLQGVVLARAGMRAGTWMIAVLMVLLVLAFVLNQLVRKRAAI